MNDSKMCSNESIWNIASKILDEDQMDEVLAGYYRMQDQYDKIISNKER